MEKETPGNFLTNARRYNSEIFMVQCGPNQAKADKNPNMITNTYKPKTTIV